MTDEQTVERVEKAINGPQSEAHIGADNLRELQDYRWYNQTTSHERACCLSDARAAIAAMQPALAEAEARGRNAGLREALTCADESAGSLKAHDLTSEAYGAIRARNEILALIDTDAPAPVRLLARNQPCGCIVCYCDDDEQCQGCGARSCPDHHGARLTSPVYAEELTCGAKSPETDPQPNLTGTSEPQAAPDVTVQQAAKVLLGKVDPKDIGGNYPLDQYGRNWFTAALIALAGGDQT